MTAIANNLEALINLNGSLEAHFLHLNKILLFWREFEQNNMLCNQQWKSLFTDQTSWKGLGHDKILFGGQITQICWDFHLLIPNSIILSNLLTIYSQQNIGNTSVEEIDQCKAKK